MTFPLIPRINESDTYQAMIQTVTGEYTDNIDSLKTTLQEAQTCAEQWLSKYNNIEPLKIENTPADLRTELFQGIGKYQDTYRAAREQARTISELYTQTMRNCQAPQMDVSTIQTLQKLGYDIVEMRETYNSVFNSEQLNILQSQKEEIELISFQLNQACDKIKQGRCNRG